MAITKDISGGFIPNMDDLNEADEEKGMKIPAPSEDLKREVRISSGTASKEDIEKLMQHLRAIGHDEMAEELREAFKDLFEENKDVEVS